MHRLESHKWVEVNSRVNYPVIVEKLESGEFFYENPKVQYCVSWFSIQVCNVGISIFVSSWNSHGIHMHM